MRALGVGLCVDCRGIEAACDSEGKAWGGWGGFEAEFIAGAVSRGCLDAVSTVQAMSIALLTRVRRAWREGGGSGTGGWAEEREAALVAAGGSRANLWVDGWIEEGEPRRRAHDSLTPAC